jgi:hypothetical protein
MHEAREIVPTPQMDSARAELLAEAMVEVRTRVRCYVQEPADATWHNLLDALRRIHGDSETYDLLRAVEIHFPDVQPAVTCVATGAQRRDLSVPRQ